MPPAASQKVIINYLLLICLACSAQLAHAVNQVGAAKPAHNSKPDQNHGTTTQTNEATNTSNQTTAGVDDILRDTLQLLDSLDQRLAVVTNHTNGKLRSLEVAGGPVQAVSAPPNTAKWSPGQPSGWRDPDAELTSLAEGFSSERHPSGTGSSADLIGAAATNPQVAVSRDLPPEQARNGRQLSTSDEPTQLPVLGARAATGNQGGRFDNDFTERHIRFSLDLMRAVFAQHSYTAKSNTLDSFLISPVSLQLVLMMMHLGARGATKRELSHALHLLDSSPVVYHHHQLHHHPHHHHHHQQQLQLNHLANEAGKPSGGATTTNATTSQAANLKTNSSNNGKNAKLTRRHQQQQQQQNSSTAPNSRQAQAHQANQNNNNNNNVNAAATASQPSHQSQSQQREQLNNVHEQFGNALRQLLKDSTVAKALTSANQIFLQRDLPLAPHYEWAVRHYYGADLRLVDFQNQHGSVALSGGGGGGGGGGGAPKSSNATAAPVATNSTQQSAGGVQQMINEWVERQTRGKISNFLASPVPTSTLLMALNVLFFKGDWQYKFDPQDTDTDAWFTQTSLRTVKLPMMVNKLPLAYAHDPAMKTSIIELPYKAQRLGLFILLPDEIDGIFDTMQALNSSSFANLISMMRKSDNSPGGGVNVRLPKFSIESSPRMSQILSQQLGLKTLFTPDQADLSGMFTSGGGGGSQKQTSGNSSTEADHGAPSSLHHQTPQVGLDELLHKAVLQVHEQGSVAAAASATIVERVGLFNGQYFEADHPFLLFLMDKQTGLVLFSGVFAGPPESGGQEVAPSSAGSDQQSARANSTAQVTPGSGGGSSSSSNNSGNPVSGRNPKQQQQQQQQPTAGNSS